MTVKVENTGQTLLENKPGDSGHITFALRRNAWARRTLSSAGTRGIAAQPDPGQSTEAVVQFTCLKTPAFRMGAGHGGRIAVLVLDSRHAGLPCSGAVICIT